MGIIKRLSGILLSLALMLTMMPLLSQTAYADDYDIWVGGTRVTSANADNILGDGTASYDADDGVLILNGVSGISGTHENARIYSSDNNLRIKVLGTNTINSTDDNSRYGIKTYRAQLTIIGDGTLNVTGSENAVNVGGELNIPGESTVTVAAETKGTDSKNAIDVQEKIDISGGTVRAAASAQSAYAVYSEHQSISVTGGTVEAAASGSDGRAICSPAAVIIEDGTVNATASGDRGYAIYSRDGVRIKGGTVNAAATGDDGFAIYSDINSDVNISGGTVEATAHNAEVAHDGIYATRDIIIGANAKLTAAGDRQALHCYDDGTGKVKNAVKGTGWTDYEGTSGEAEIEISEDASVSGFKKVRFPAKQYYQLWVGGTQVTSKNMSGDGWSYTPATTGEDATPATLTLNGVDIRNVYTGAIYYKESEDLNIVLSSGSENKVEDCSLITSTENADVTISGTGKLDVSCSSNGYYGINVRDDLTISGGTVTIDSNNSAIYSFSGAVTISGGTVNVDSKKSAIYSERNAVTISGGNVTADSTGSDSYAIYALDDITVSGGTVEATANGSNGCAIEGREVNISDGTVTAAAGTKAISGGKVNIGGGKVTATASNDGSVGVSVTDSVTISSGDVSASGFRGIASDEGNITISGGTVDASGEKAGIYAGPDIFSHNGMVEITGGSVTAEGTGDSSTGINGVNGVTISGGNLTASGKGQGISGLVTNEIKGTGWTNTAGTEGKESIPVDTAGRELNKYKKLRFPAVPAATVTAAPTAKTLTENGSAQGLVNTGQASGGTMHYALGKDATTVPANGWSAEIPTGTNAGTYYIWYKAVGDADHTDTAPKCITVNISEKTPDPTPTPAPTSIQGAKVVLSATAFTYNGKVRKPSIKTIGGKKLTAGTDYIVKWSSSSPKNVGSYTLTITGKGKYAGTTKAKYKINPKGTSLKSLTKAKQAITIKWNKQTAKMAKVRITGYQIQLATDKKFKKNKKLVTVKGYKKETKNATNLKAKKKYYVRIRTYRTIGKTNYYSPWSKVKSVKIL